MLVDGRVIGKIAAIQDCESPKTASEARSFIGLVQYSAKFIPDLASIARPIQDLTRKHVDFVWGKKQQYAFDKLKSLMTKPDVLAYFRNDCQTVRHELLRMHRRLDSVQF